MVMEIDFSRQDNKDHFKGLPLEDWLSKIEEKKDGEKF
jgi:hypothetical protein